MKAANLLAADGVEAEVIDLRTLRPLDIPVPYSPPLEDAFLPNAGRIAAEIRARTL